MLLLRPINLVILSFLCLGIAHPSQADQRIDFYSGIQAGTYQTISQDLKRLLAEKGLDVESQTTDGSIDNIKNIAASTEPAMGIVQADILGFMRRSDNPDTQRFAERIRMMMPMYQEEVHILARKDIRTLKDLQGKKVVIGEDGSGNMLTAVNILAIEDIRLEEPLRLSPPEGVRAVLEGSADAVIYVAGKPVKLFKNIENLKTADGNKFSNLLKGVHFIPITSKAILAEYAQASISSKDYSFVRRTIPTIAVQAVLITGNYLSPANQTACKLVAKAAQQIYDNVTLLKKTGHPKWRNIDTELPVALWERDECSWPINQKKP